MVSNPENHAVNLVEKIEAAFKQYKYVLVIHLDIAGTFDGAWHPAIIKGLIDRQCPQLYGKFKYFAKVITYSKSPDYVL